MARPQIPATPILALFAFGLLLGGVFLRGSAQGQRIGCPDPQRRDALSAIEAHVLRTAPDKVASFETALRPGGPLAGWRLAHGYVVLHGVGAIAVEHPDAKFPEPQALHYAPAPNSNPASWLDFDGPDGPYRLVGWTYVAPYRDEAIPPVLVPRVSSQEWVLHEAGWHLRDGGIRLTPYAEEEPPRPADGPGVHFWHPRQWDLRFWRAARGAPVVSFHNPAARPGGLRLPRGAFTYMFEGRPWPDPGQRGAIPIGWEK